MWTSRLRRMLSFPANDLLGFLAVLFSVLIVSAESATERRIRVDYDQPDHVMDRGEQEALYDVMEALVNDTRWRKNHPHPCSYDPWPGLECQQLDDFLLHVTKIDVGSNAKTRCKQSPTISPAIFKLAHLKAVVIMSCFVASNTSITIPSGLDKLAPSLEILSLRGNTGLTGTIPKELGNLKKLEVLSLSQNGLQGTIPPQLGSLQKLKNLDLSYNSLTGALPQELGNMGGLSILDLSNNKFQGRIPGSIGKLQQLKKLDLSNNYLDGSIPASFGNLNALQFLALDRNNLTGGLPPALQRLSNLQYLLVQDNPMHTAVPDFWASLGKLSELRLSNSGYTGTIPASIANLRNLTELAVDRNLLTGPIPVTLESLPNIYHLNLSNNLLQGTVPFTASFWSRLGENLDLHGNDGLCMAKPMLAPGGRTSNLKTCNGKSAAQTSSGSLNHVFIFFFLYPFWTIFHIF